MRQPSGLSVPKDSALRWLLAALSITEYPFAYQVFCGLSAIGIVLRRNVYFDQLRWKVYPNLSVMLVGPSGVGKDSVINEIKHIVTEVMGKKFIIGGRTMEQLYERLMTVGDPAAAYLPIGELTAFFGGKDYQKSMVQELTDLLSGNDYVDISTKHAPDRFIQRPTLTVHGGSTAAWLQKAMPDGSMEGGLFPRFLVVVEPYADHHVALVKHSLTKRERDNSDQNLQEFKLFLGTLKTTYGSSYTEIIPNDDAKELYTNWYHNRFKYFSAVVEPYANRSRDQVLRLAMLMAISRSHTYMDETDMEFAFGAMRHIAARLDDAIKPPTTEAQCAEALLDLMPSTFPALIKSISRHYPMRVVRESLDLLRESKQFTITDAGIYRQTQ